MLEVGKNATEKEIKKAFYQSSLKHHPDKSKEERSVATRKFQQIEEAYRLLMNTSTRKAYDLEGLECARNLYIELLQGDDENNKSSDRPESSASENEPYDEPTTNKPEMNYNSQPSASSTHNPEPNTSQTGFDQEMGDDSDDEVVILYERINCPDAEMNVVNSSESSTSSSSEDSEESFASDISIKSCEWLVDRIIDEREENGVTQYLIKWIGFDDLTWEPECNLNNCKLALNKFKRKKRRRMRRDKLLRTRE